MKTKQKRMRYHQEYEKNSTLFQYKNRRDKTRFGSVLQHEYLSSLKLNNATLRLEVVTARQRCSELERRRIHAVAQACRVWAIVEHMAQMRAASGTLKLHAPLACAQNRQNKVTNASISLAMRLRVDIFKRKQLKNKCKRLRERIKTEGKEM